MMDELVQDLVSALEQTSQQNNLGHLWEEMVLSPLQQRRQIRRRRGRKRRCESLLHPLQLRHCLSESSLDETVEDCRESAALAPSTTTTANYSDSDDMIMTRRWHSFARDSARSRQHSWPESDSFAENAPGRPLRRRRRVKHVTSDVMLSLQRKLKLSAVDGESAVGHRSLKKQRLSRIKKASGGWNRVKRQAEGVGLLAKECWKDKIMLEAKEQRDASDENMSDGDTSSICSSDPGLFTNDEGRQGDDEQSDWFFEGDCGAGKGVTGLMPSWDSDGQLGLEDKRPGRTFLQPAQPSQRGFNARLNRLPGVAARCVRKGWRRILTKDNRMPMFVDRMKHFAQNPYQRDFRPLSFGKRDRSQFNSFCSLPVYPVDIVPENCHRGCSSSVCKNRQANVRMGLLCTRDVKRRRKAPVLLTKTSANIHFYQDELREETQGASTIQAVETSCAIGREDLQPSTSDLPDLIQQRGLFNSQGDQVDN